MPPESKPAPEEDVRISKILGAVLLIILPIFGFYVASVFAKTNAVDGVIWHYDYMASDLWPSLRGAGYGFVIAVGMNAWIWFRYCPSRAHDENYEWYEPQKHRSAGHH